MVFKENARKAGVEINIVQQEWSVFLQNIGTHQFDMYYGAWVGEFAPEDHSQLFHTSEIAEGSNFTGFGNKATDALIDSIKVEMDEVKRSEMYKRFQRLFFDECHYIFICSSYNLFVTNKKFDNVYPSGMYPGFWIPGFKPAKTTAK